jgi:hypothetical protein
MTTPRKKYNCSLLVHHALAVSVQWLLTEKIILAIVNVIQSRNIRNP